MHAVKIRGGADYRVGKIICLARNYAEHARELGNEVPDRPVFFMKPASSIIGPGGTVIIPGYSRECHHEVELAVLIGRRGKDIPMSNAMTHVAGYGVGIDLTLRDVQNELKKKGLPWEIAKGFDTACPLGEFVPAGAVADPHALEIWLRVNGEIRQNSTTGLMLRRIPEIIREVSAVFTLEEGDVILTGTPAGVGPVKSGDQMEAGIEKVGTLEVRVK